MEVRSLLPRKLMSVLIILTILLVSITWDRLGEIDIHLGDDKHDPGLRIISFNETHAYEHEENLYDLGPRTAGTPAELDGAYYIYDRFVEAGLHNVHMEEFTQTLYEVNGGSEHDDAYLYVQAVTDTIIIDEEYDHKEDFMVLGYSGSTHGTETYDVVYVGNGTDEAYAEAGDVSGMAVLVLNDGTYGSTASIYLQAMNHSAAAVMQYNPGREAPISKTAVFENQDRELVPLPEYYPDAELIPHMMLSAEKGGDLRDAAENVDTVGEYCEVDIDLHVTVEERTSYNVVGDIKGKSKGLVIIGAHMDTVYCGRGALDNTAGSSIVTELAYSLAEYHPEKTIRLVTFGSEEAGILGSQAYVREHLDELRKHMELMINLDMTDIDPNADENCLRLRPSTEEHMEGLNRTAKKFFEENPDLAENYSAEVVVEPGLVGSDHRSFYIKDFDVCAAWGNHGEGYHTPGDVIGNTHPESWPVIGGIVGSYALYLASR